jgi:4-carboxymuconolactone decarboxylase
MDLFDAGMRTRRAVLGDGHVDRAEQNRTEFNREFQDFITRYAWGEVWTRPGLDRRTRSCMTLAMLTTLNRSEEFQLHVRAARNNGLSWDEIKEVILHTAIYAGVPAANHAFKLAEEIRKEETRE